MPSTVWKGSLSFGLVNIPVGLQTAASDHTIRFHQLERDTADRVRNKRINERTGNEVDYADIVKGYDLGGGEYVVVTQDELEAAAPEHTRTVDIVGFVDQSEIDPIYYRSAYYLAPDGAAAPRAYALLREVMNEANKVAVALFVLRNKEHLVTVRARSDVLVLETMYFADEIRDTSELSTVPSEVEFTDRERETARLLLDSMTKEWEPEDYQDTYRERVAEIVERKRRGETIVAERPPEPAPVIDLVQALQASIDRAERRDSGGDGGAEELAAAAGRPAAVRPARSATKRATGASVAKGRASKGAAKAGAKAPRKTAAKSTGKPTTKTATPKRVASSARRRAS
jgi:DNA end-binding protein Ku